MHIGAHDCEEYDAYTTYGIHPTNIIWIDGLQDKVTNAIHRGIPNVFKAIISDKDDETITFYRTNNDQSSSIFEMGTHMIHHPEVIVTSSYTDTTLTIDTFLHLWTFKTPILALKNLNDLNEEFILSIG